jgi:hypothetical protein
MDETITPEIEAKEEKKIKAPKKLKGKKGNKKAHKAKRTYPTITLEKCLIVAKKIKELNGGNSWSGKEVSEAIGIREQNKLFYFTAASRDFGLTIGTNSTKEGIALTDLGRNIVYAPNPEIERQKKIEAFLKIEIFRNVLDYYKGSNLPEMKYLANTLENQFKLDPEFHEEFSQVFKQNCTELGITTGNPLDSEKSISSNGNGSSSSIIVLGEAKKGTKGKLKAFVIMPFSEKNDKRPDGFFKEVLENLIVPAGIDSGFTVETAKKQGSDIIQSTIINDLLEADLVIADLTDHNPNVLFELGVRMAVDKPVALIKSKDTGKIFDVDNMLRVYEYNENLWKSTVAMDIPSLIEHFQAAWDNRESEQTYMKILRKGIVNQH